VLTIASVMTADQDGTVAGEVRSDARVASVAARLRHASHPFAVVDPDGRRVGAVTRDAVADVLLRG
jgi:ABC-type proline/glycine betaine transport system ATPase subunit